MTDELVGRYMTVEVQRQMFGSRYRCTFSGFEGTCVAVAVYRDAGPEALLIANTGSLGDDKQRWFKVSRLEPIEEKKAGFS